MNISNTASSNVLHVMELAEVISCLTNMLESSTTSVLLGEQSIYADPVCEALWRLVNRKTHMLVKRQIIPGNSNTDEIISVDNAIYNRPYLLGLLKFKEELTMFPKPLSTDKLKEAIDNWTTTLSSDMPVMFDTSVREIKK